MPVGFCRVIQRLLQGMGTGLAFRRPAIWTGGISAEVATLVMIVSEYPLERHAAYLKHPRGHSQPREEGVGFPPRTRGAVMEYLEERRDLAAAFRWTARLNFTRASPTISASP